MGSQVSNGASAATHQSESVIRFAASARSDSSNGADQLDNAGQTILRLLNKAAGVAEENSRFALDQAQKLSHQLRAAEDRIAELERRLRFIKKEPSARNTGSTKSTRRLRTDS